MSLLRCRRPCGHGVPVRRCSIRAQVDSVAEVREALSKAPPPVRELRNEGWIGPIRSEETPEGDGPLSPLDLKAIDAARRLKLEVVDSASFGIGYAEPN